MKHFQKILILLFCITIAFIKGALADNTINMMVFATPEAIARMGGADSATIKTERDIANINQSFVNSNINGNVRLVYRGDYQFPDTNMDMQDMLNYILFTRDWMRGTINDLWQDFGADVVVFIVDDSIQCGLAGDYHDANQAVIILNYKCMGANYSMARELGYLLGCGNNETQNGRYNSFSNTAYAYFHDYELNGDTVFSTIMGYTDEQLAANDDDFNMIPYWSTPDTASVRYMGLPVGDSVHNNGSQIRKALPYIARYEDENTILKMQYFNLHQGQMAKLEITNTGYLESSELDAGSNAWFGAQHMNIRNVRMRKGSYVSIGANIIK